MRISVCVCREIILKTGEPKCDDLGVFLLLNKLS